MEHAVIIKSGLFEINKNYMVAKQDKDKLDKQLLETKNTRTVKMFQQNI